jgi:spore coat polysaccharide biosynthesis protein SpsF
LFINKKQKNGNSYALVTARSTSTRLPNKCFQLIADRITIIQVVIRRAKKIGCPVILATTEDPSDDHLEEIALKEDVGCFRGSVKNKIRRWADCFHKYNIAEGLLVDGDDPTFDYNVGARALDQLRKDETDMVIISPEMTPGFFTYGITKNGIEKLLTKASNAEMDTDVITEFINLAGLTKSYVVTLPEETEGHNVRLTVDYPEDVEFYRALYRKVDYLAPAPEIVRVALENNFQEINWHMQEQFLENQRKFNERVKSYK